MFLLALLMLAMPAAPQATNVTVQPDLRLFTTMAALNAAGFDVEYGSEYSPVREAVRKFAKEIDGDLLGRLQAFYKSHKQQQTDQAQLGKYISLAVNISDAPAFKPLAKDEVGSPGTELEFAL